MAVRLDRNPINNYEELEDGRLRVKATISRVGDLKYVQPDGNVRVEKVTADELFDKVSLDSAGLAPVTLGHPSVGLVTPDNWKKYAVGASGSTVVARNDAGLVEVVFVVGDADAIAAIKKKKVREVSAGYTTEVEKREDGFYQTKRRYNHFAIVEKGRAGADVRLHMDAADDFAVQFFDEDNREDKAGMAMIEVPDEYLSQVKAMLRKLEGGAITTEDMSDWMSGKGKKKLFKGDSLDLDTAIALLEKTDARADALKAELDTVGRKLGDRLRSDALQAAKHLLPHNFDASRAPTVTDVYRHALAHSMPDLKLDGKSEEAIAAAYEVLAQSRADTEEDPMAPVFDRVYSSRRDSASTRYDQEMDAVKNQYESAWMTQVEV